MKKIFINRPVDLKVDGDNSLEGRPTLKSDQEDSNLEVNLIRQGSDIDEGLTLSGDGTQPGGVHIKDLNQIEVPIPMMELKGMEPLKFFNTDDEGNSLIPGGAMPRTFTEPFRFKYRMGPGELVGQSNKGVVEYDTIRIDSGDLNRVHNSRFFSFNNALHFVADYEYNSGIVVVRVYRLDDSNGVFELVKEFSDIKVDTTGEVRGRPDACVLEGTLVVCYRSVIRGADVSDRYEMVHASTEDGAEWATHTTPIGGRVLTEVSGGDWRLRVAAGGGAICATYMAREPVETTIETLDGGGQPTQTNVVIFKKDIRTFTSYDYGKGFSRNEGGYSAFARVENDSRYVEDETFTGLPSYFRPSGGSNLTDPDDLTSFTDEFNVRFGLYYDEAMGSFVIMKSGDPSDAIDNQPRFAGAEGDGPEFADDGAKCGLHLMAIKTIDGDFSRWEQCLDFRLTVENTFGMLPKDGAQGIDHFSFWGEGGGRNDSFLDIDIETSGPINTASLVLESGNFDNPKTCHFEFRFIDSVKIPINPKAPPLGVGTKWHDRYAFCMAPLNPYISGPMAIGDSINASALTEVGTPSLCRFRHQLVARINSRCYGRFGPLTTIGERNQYPMNYCKEVCSLEDFVFSISSNNASPNVPWEEVGTSGAWNKFKMNLDGDYLYASWPNFSGEPGAPRGGPRCRFTLQLLDSDGESLDSDPANSGSKSYYSIFQSGTDVDGVTLQLHTVDGKLRLLKDLNTVHTTEAIDFSQGPIEIMIGAFSNNVAPPGSELISPTVYFHWRHKGGEWQDSFFSGFADLNMPNLKLGCVGIEQQDVQYTIGIGDVQAGDPGFFETLYPEGVRLLGPGETGDRMFYDTTPMIETYENRLELNDGSEVEVYGRGYPQWWESNFSLNNSSGQNRLDNIVDGLADSIYEFTRLYDSLEGFVIELMNPNQDYVDTFSFINIHGVSEIEIGNETYEVPAESLGVDAVEPSYPEKVYVEEELVVGELVGKSLMVKDLQSGEYLDHYFIIENTDGSVALDREFAHQQDMDGKQAFVMRDAFSVEVDGSIDESFEVNLWGPSQVSIRCLGQVMAGRLIDLSDSIDGMQRSTITNFELIESDFGRAYPEMLGRGNVFTSVELSAATLSPYYYHKMFYAINDLYESQKPFALISRGTNESTDMAVMSDSWSFGPDDMFKEVSVSMICQDWHPMDKLGYPSMIEASIQIGDSTHGVGEEIFFTAYAVDLSGYDLNYRWDLGDGTVIETENSQVSHQYDNAGYKFIQLLVENEVGNAVLVTASIEIVNLS